MAKKTSGILKNQCGAALVIALVMIVVLTLIGLASTYTSIFEIKLSGNKRGTTNAFYTADGGGKLVQPVINNFSMGNYTAVNLGSLPPYLVKESIDLQFPSPALDLPVGVNYTVPPSVTIYHLPRTDAPRGQGISATGNFGFNHFIIDSVGNDQADISILPSSSHLAEKIVKILPSSQGGN